MQNRVSVSPRTSSAISATGRMKRCVGRFRSRIMGVSVWCWQHGGVQCRRRRGDGGQNVALAIARRRRRGARKAGRRLHRIRRNAAREAQQRDGRSLHRRSRDGLQGATALDFMPQPLGVVLHGTAPARDARAEVRDVRGGSRRSPHLGAGVFDDGGRWRIVRATRPRCTISACASAKPSRCARRPMADPHAAAIRLDASGRYGGVDDEFCAWSGHQREDVIGNRFTDLLRPTIGAR